jgi:hypothetical protein
MIQSYNVCFPSDYMRWLHEDEIKRKLNKKEIEDFKFKEDANKYNL